MKSWLTLFMTLTCVAPCMAQVVQLPAVSNFSVNTTVSVPDQGTASLGGVGRSSYGRTTRGFGPLGSTARGGQVGASSMSVTATIIDLAAMDEALLNLAAEQKAKIPSNHTPRHVGTKIVNTLTPHHYERDMTQRTVPPQPYDWMRALGPQTDDMIGQAESRVRDGTNVRFFMEKAAQAKAAGRTAAAEVYYNMALERMTPAQRTRLDELIAKSQGKPNGDSKKDKAPANSPVPAQTAPENTSSDSAASPFDTPATDAGANTDMNASPF